MNKIDRRSFLLSLAATGGTAAVFGASPLVRLARAGGPSATDRYYIFCYFGGGWDILLSLDPRDPTQFTNENMGETLVWGGYEMLDDPGHITAPIRSPEGNWFGPYIGDLLDHSAKMAVIRGMSMETLTHEAGRRRFITGKAPSGLLARGSSIATFLAGELGSEELVPQISVQVESYNKDYPSYASALSVNSIADLIRAFSPGDVTLSSLEERQLDDLLTEQSWCKTARQSKLWTEGEEARRIARDMVAARLDSHFDFTANNPEMAALRDFYNMPAGNAALTSPEGQAAAAVRALTQGISRAVSIRVASALDTHGDEWSTDQGPEQERGFNAVARMVEDLSAREYPDGSGDSWMDRTVIVGFSEFCRTALLNARGGRDHNLNNACFVLGAGIRGGNVIGRSSEVGLGPATVNLATGRFDQGGEVVRPEHVLRALLVDAGIDNNDAADLRVDPLDALLVG